jgi:hypothetical protein
VQIVDHGSTNTTITYSGTATVLNGSSSLTARSRLEKRKIKSDHATPPDPGRRSP